MDRTRSTHHTLPPVPSQYLHTTQSQTPKKTQDKDGRPLGYLTMRGHDPKTRDLDACLRCVGFGEAGVKGGRDVVEGSA